MGMRTLEEDLRPGIYSRLCELATNYDCVVETLAWTKVVRSPRESQQIGVYKSVESTPGLAMRARLFAWSAFPKAGPSSFE
ncbi:hypothetical protein K443DRAFT_165780 [Laccaria amethystina LaAM-08-1]|jgi:hypothetical protein|uniref:Uncharacterized protein n=1 Tax=Laccaria amethystina LaAM-08-1 TaxID=1095629 RepID=A0A0C9YBC8_9AGAR|nr:hypothetical protein K443DRAFT_165780 [Laccaria amethystina LaAM-08-1]